MNECGGGGSRDVLQLVQDHPADLDAAAAVGFVYDSLHHGIGQMWVFQATHKTEASYIPPSKYPLIHRAALDSCDAKDGLKDGIIEDPPRCTVNLDAIACKAGDAPTCLTAPQIAAVKQIYSPAVHARTGRYLFAGMAPGGELQWEPMAGPAPYNYAPGFYRNAVFRDQAWEWKSGLPNFDSHVDLAEAAPNQIIQATKADIRPFLERGGKLLLVGGWADHTLAPGSFVDYYESVVKAVGRDSARSSVRLFMVPRDGSLSRQPDLRRHPRPRRDGDSSAVEGHRHRARHAPHHRAHAGRGRGAHAIRLRLSAGRPIPRQGLAGRSRQLLLPYALTPNWTFGLPLGEYVARIISPKESHEVHPACGWSGRRFGGRRDSVV